MAILRAVAGFVAAVLLHAACDGFDSVWVHVVVGTISFVAPLLTIRAAHRRPAVPPPGPDAPLLSDSRDGNRKVYSPQECE